MEKKRKLTEAQKKRLINNTKPKTTSLQVTDVLKKPLVKATVALVAVYGVIIVSRLFIKEIAGLVLEAKKLKNARKL